MKDETRFLTIKELMKQLAHWKANHAVIKERCGLLRAENKRLREELANRVKELDRITNEL